MEMNQQNQASDSFSTPDVTVKKKRGRPRKDPSQPSGRTAYVPRKMGLSQNYGKSTPVPPGFEEVNEAETQPVNADNDNNMSSMVGQVVTGVIEAVFDAGFLLSVRVGNTNTSLRGVVFKSGQYVPVSAENDLVPGLPMIKRHEVPFPALPFRPVITQTYKHKHRGRKRSEREAVYHSNGSPGSNQVSQAQCRQLAIVPVTLDPLDGRGTLVPVVLQPLHLSNGGRPAVEVHPIASQPAHLAASKGKHNGLTQVVPEGTKVNFGISSLPFEEMFSVAKNTKGGPYSAEMLNDSAKLFSKMLPDDSSLTQEGQDLSKPLHVEPLQSVHSRLPDRSVPMSHAFPERSTGKMTELLLAVQQNLMERQMSDNQHHEYRNPEK